MGTLPHMALQGGSSKGTCTQRSVSPPASGHESIDHRSTSDQPFAQWTRRHFRTAGHRPLVTSHLSNGHYTRIFKSVNHRSPAIQPLVIGLRKYQHRGSVFTGHQSTRYWSLVIRIYINLHLVKLMPWACSLIIIVTQKSFIIPGIGL